MLPLCGFYASAIARVSAPVRAPRRCAGQRVPRRRRRQGLPAVGRGQRRQRRRIGGRRVTTASERMLKLLFRSCVSSVAARCWRSRCWPPRRRRAGRRQPDPRRARSRTRSASRGCTGWRKPSAMLLADELNARGRRRRSRATERVRAFEQLHLPLAASLSRATVIKVGQLVGASEVIVGAFVLDGGRAHGRQRTASAIDVGRLQPDVTEQRAARRSVRDLRPARPDAWRRASADGRRGARPPLDAFENYIKGLIAESPAGAGDVSRNRGQAVSRVRSRRARAVGRADTIRTTTPRRWPRPAPCRPPRRWRAGARFSPASRCSS